MFTKAFIIIIMLVILYCLGSGLFYLARDEDKDRRMLKALTWRIGLSVALFLLLLIGFALGMIVPHGLYNQ